MNAKRRIERLERISKVGNPDGPLPLHVVATIMEAGDAGRDFTPAERRELDMHAETIKRLVARGAEVESEHG